MHAPYSTSSLLRSGREPESLLKIRCVCGFSVTGPRREPAEPIMPCRNDRQGYLPPLGQQQSPTHACTVSVSVHLNLGLSLEIPLYHHARFSLPYPLRTAETCTSNFKFIMSLTGQAASSYNVQLVTSALADYSKETGIDLSNHPFATALEQSNSAEAILQVLQQREKAFKEYRDGSRRLINCLSPAVNIFQAFSGILGEAVSLVSLTTELCLPSDRPFLHNIVRSPSPQQRRCSSGSMCFLMYVSSIRY